MPELQTLKCPDCRNMITQELYFTLLSEIKGIVPWSRCDKCNSRNCYAQFIHGKSIDNAYYEKLCCNCGYWIRRVA